MVAINGRKFFRRVVGVLCDNYNRCLTKLFHRRPTMLRPSRSLTHTNPKRPNRQIPKARKQGPVRRKRYNEPAKDNSAILMPGGFCNDPLKMSLQDDHEPDGRDSETTYEAVDGRASQDPPTRWDSYGAANEQGAFVMKQFDSLMFDKLKRESQFNVKVISERVKRKAPEREVRLRKEATEVEMLRRMKELERREEKERADRWKDRRLAQLEREKLVAKDELAREKVQRKRSRLRRLFEEQQRRHREEGLREREARFAAEREANLLRENAILGMNLRATDNALRRACNERDYMVQEKEEERTRRLRAEKSLHRWKELMKEYFPGGQRPQYPDQQQEQPQQPLLEAQFELYEKKWEVLRSGVDIDGTQIHRISFSQIPWPVVNMTPTDPSQIRPEHIREFLVHPLREKPGASGHRRSTKVKARDELKRWHYDQFNRIVLPKVHEEDKLAASEVAEMIARVLTENLS